jgi:hypothetical protein
MRSADDLRAEAGTVVWHVPRHPDQSCDCPAAPCGLTVPRPGCEPHRAAMATLAMSIHPEHRCPGPRLEPHHRAARTPTDDEDLALRRRKLLDGMAASAKARLDRIRESEGRLL